MENRGALGENTPTGSAFTERARNESGGALTAGRWGTRLKPGGNTPRGMPRETLRLAPYKNGNRGVAS